MRTNLPLAKTLFIGLALSLSALEARAQSTLVVDDNSLCPGAAFTSINAAITAAAPNDIVKVCAGLYNEDVVVNKTLTLSGAGYSTTTISGPIGGGGAGIQVAAAGVIVEGFTVTRDGNNTTDWNNAGLNSVGIAIQGAASAEVRNCLLTGNRTGIDINNSNGNNVHNNIIDFNRTGAIFRNQTDNTLFQNNVVTNNWTVGVLFLDASGGTNVPVQSALFSSFTQNQISNNWYAQAADRQTGGSLPAPGANPKNFATNYWGTAVPTTTTNPSGEPGYAAQIPTAYGGSAAPQAAPFDIADSASANIQFASPATRSVRSAIDANASEGNANTNKNITLTRTGATGVITVNYAFGGGTAGDPEDYIVVTTGGVCATANSCAFTAAQTTRPVRFRVNGDTKHELDETVVWTFSGITGVGVIYAGPSTYAYTIQNDDAVPTILAFVPNVPEGSGGGTTILPAEIRLSNATYQNVTFSAATTTTPTGGAAGTLATPGAGPAFGVDYLATSVTNQVIPAGSTSFAFPITIYSDNLNEVANERVYVEVATPSTNANDGALVDFGNVQDDDALPVVSIVGPAPGNELNSGTHFATFTINLDVPSGRNVTVRATTTPTGANPASNPSDYTATTTNFTFLPGQTSMTYDVTVKGDTTPENDETFLVTLSNFGSVTPSGSIQATGTILNDDSPTVAIEAAKQVTETNAGTTTISFTVSILTGIPDAVNFTYHTTDGTAVSTGPNADYVSMPAGNGTIPANQTQTTVTLTVNGDTTQEAYENFTVVLDSAACAGGPPCVAALGNAVGTATIRNDDAVPAGSLKISEFRFSGPGGASDEYVEVANVTSAPVSVYTTDATTGFAVAQDSGVVLFTIPNGTVIPPYGHYLGVNSVAYSLGAYAASDSLATWSSNIPDNNTGIALFSNGIAAGSPMDAVGVGTPGDPLYVEGTGLAAVGTVNAVSGSYAYARRFPYGGGTTPIDNGTNSADFVLVAVDPAGYGGLVPNPVLGGPSPENLASPTERTGAELSLSLFDTGQPSNAAPNYKFTPTNPGVTTKFIELRRKVTSNATFSSLRFKVTALSTVNNDPGPGVTSTDFRIATTTDGMFQPNTGLTLENVGYIAGAPATGDPQTGGIGSTLTVPSVTLGTPITSGVPVGVNFKLIYTIGGMPSYFWVTPEAK